MPDQTFNWSIQIFTSCSIHFPIAMLFVGTAIELLAFMWRGSGFRAAGRWMILIGALASIPAATTGTVRSAAGDGQRDGFDARRA